MKRSFAFAVLLFSLGLAAGGCASSPDDSTEGTTGTQGSTGTFNGSCTTTFGDGSMSCSEDYHNSPAWMKQQCAEASTASSPATYSAGHCSTVGLTGKCKRRRLVRGPGAASGRKFGEFPCILGFEHAGTGSA